MSPISIAALLQALMAVDAWGNEVSIKINDLPDQVREERLSPRLRFVRRDGKAILQQLYVQITWDGKEILDWRDVPMETEE